MSSCWLASIRCRYCNCTFNCSNSIVFSRISFWKWNELMKKKCVFAKIVFWNCFIYTWMSCCSASRCFAIDFSRFWAAIAWFFSCSTSLTIVSAIPMNSLIIFRNSCSSMDFTTTKNANYFFFLFNKFYYFFFFPRKILTLLSVYSPHFSFKSDVSLDIFGSSTRKLYK